MIWKYGGYNIFPASINSAGIRWYAMLGNGVVAKADTKDSMRRYIKEHCV